MNPGYETYLRLKAHLVLKDLSLTDWCAELGTGSQHVRSVVMKFAGSDRVPRNPMAQQILAAVYAELATNPVPIEYAGTYKTPVH